MLNHEAARVNLGCFFGGGGGSCYCNISTLNIYFVSNSLMQGFLVAKLFVCF